LVENLEWGLELARKKSVVEKEWESEEALEKGKASEKGTGMEKEKEKATGKELALVRERNRQYVYHLE